MIIAAGSPGEGSASSLVPAPQDTGHGASHTGVMAVAVGAGVAAVLAAGLRSRATTMDAWRAALLIGRTGADDLPRHALDGVLANGLIVPGTVRKLDGGSSPNGLRRAILTSADGSAGVEAVLKRETAAQEEFGYLMARALGIEHLVPAVSRRSDGRAAIQFIYGRTLDLAGISDGAGVRRALDGWYRTQRGMSPERAAAAAEVDHELLAFLDWLTANRDRKATNAMQDALDDSLWFIDSGGMLRGELEDVLRPRLKDALYVTDPGTPNRIVLSPRTRSIIAERLTPEALREAHAVLRRPLPGPKASHRRLVLERAGSDHQLDRLLQRRAAALERGWIEYQPVTRRSRIDEERAFWREIRSGTFDTWAGVRALDAPAAGSGP